MSELVFSAKPSTESLDTPSASSQSFIFVKRKYELRIRVILTRMTKSIEAVLLDRNLPPITAAKKIVMLQQTGLARLQRIAGALNSELNALSSLMAQREAGGGGGRAAGVRGQRYFSPKPPNLVGHRPEARGSWLLTANSVTIAVRTINTLTHDIDRPRDILGSVSRSAGAIHVPRGLLSFSGLAAVAVRRPAGAADPQLCEAAKHLPVRSVVAVQDRLALGDQLRLAEPRARRNRRAARGSRPRRPGGRNRPATPRCAQTAGAGKRAGADVDDQLLAGKPMAVDHLRRVVGVGEADHWRHVNRTERLRARPENAPRALLGFLVAFRIAIRTRRRCGSSPSLASCCLW